METRRQVLATLAAGALLPSLVWAQELTDEQRSALKASTYDPKLAPDLLLPPAKMAWWQDAKFGVFCHWGLYSIPGKGEWHMFNDKVPPEEYAKLAQQFNPRHYDPDKWAAVARQAGAKYFVMTARHHDGFALWNSPGSYGHYDAMHSAAHRDFIASYVKAVRKAGLRVGLYYSPLDWRFPSYFHPKELPDNARSLKRQTWNQAEELMRNYGPIDILWWDGGWLAHKNHDADAVWFWESDKLSRMVRKYQPDIVINPRSGWQGDFDVQEGDKPITGPIRARPWEKAFSLTPPVWGYAPDRAVMSSDEVVGFLVNAIVRNGNCIVNVGPDADGVIPPKQVETLQGVGRWLKQYGRAVYGTRPGPVQPLDDVYGATCIGNRVYIFVLSWPNDELNLPLESFTVAQMKNLSGSDVSFRQDADSVRISVPAQSRGTPVTVLEAVQA